MDLSCQWVSQGDSDKSRGTQRITWSILGMKQYRGSEVLEGARLQPWYYKKLYKANWMCGEKKAGSEAGNVNYVPPILQRRKSGRDEIGGARCSFIEPSPQ